jgi:GPH family glycoside/pentoside/hexuronide:cation symporter
VTAALASAAPARGLWPWSLFAATLAAAGLPLYIHAPAFYAETYHIGLGALGAVLGAIRFIDVVQDPALGWLAEAQRRHRAALVGGSMALMAGGMVGLFAVTPPVAPLLWFGLMMTVLCTAWSFLSIAFYAQGVTRAGGLGPAGHLRLATWREGGALVGVCLAATAPLALGAISAEPFAVFALIFVLATLAAGLAMRHEWQAGPAVALPGLALFRPVLADPLARRLLILALLNAAPVAVTSTLFLFFVGERLQAPDAAGPLLLAFFLAAAVSVPLWFRLASRFGQKATLMAGMVLAIISFAFALTLGPGDVLAFAVISAASGAALGADTTLLPAIFARRLAALGPGEAAAFGLWAFVSKLSLALAAVTLLPALQLAGFTPTGANPPAALSLLTLLYAGLPLALKALAIALLARTRLNQP